ASRSYRCALSSRRRHTSFSRDWSSDVCSSDLAPLESLDDAVERGQPGGHEVRPVGRPEEGGAAARQSFIALAPGHALTRAEGPRSEERRVGKEWRARCLG